MGAQTTSHTIDRQLAEAERDRLVDELRQAQERTRADLEAMTRLQRLGSLFVREGNLEPVLVEVVDAAISISGADFGNIQLLDAETSDLKIVAARGFPDWWLEFWNTVSRGHGVCGTALERGERVIVEDVERSPIFAGTPALDIQRRAGVRAVQSTPLVSRSGKPLGMFSTHWRKPGRPDERSLRLLDLLGRHAADITERAQNEEALRRHGELLQRVFENIPVLLVMWDPQLRRFTLNRNAEEVLGVSTAEANERDLISVVYPGAEYRAEAVAYMRSLQPGFRELIGRTKSGEEVPIAWANIRLTDETMIGIGVDLRERKRAEEALKAVKEQLEETDRRKNQFLAMLSHELRNPLAPIRNSLHVLDHVAPGGEQARRARAIIGRQVGHMSRLIEDLLDVTRIARGKVKLRLERLDLRAVTRRAVEDHRGEFVDGGLQLEVATDPGDVWVEGDRTRLAQVIGNLLQNAAKFTPRGGRTNVTVEADAARRCAIVRVQDTGRGIRPEIMPHLFQPFIQADASLDRAKGGLGLGLALVRGLVEMHEGSVSAASDGPGQGATFTITLPLEARGPIETHRPQADDHRRPSRVLIVEDDADAAISLREVLELAGHAVEIARSGPEGIDKALAVGPDVVICDIGLPGIDGYELARTMRADPRLGRVGLVALSGHAQPEDVAMAREAGFDAHLAKPASIDTIERTIAEVSGTRE